VVPVTVNVPWKRFPKRITIAGSIRRSARAAEPVRRCVPWKQSRNPKLSGQGGGAVNKLTEFVYSPNKLLGLPLGCRKLQKKAPFLLLTILLFPSVPSRGESLSYPLIERLEAKDAAFSRYMKEVENARGRLFLAGRRQEKERGERERDASESLRFFAYTSREGEDIWRLYARCTVPYWTIASLNRLSHAGELRPGMHLLLPSTPGLFISEEPQGELELLLYAAREERLRDQEGVSVTVSRDGREEQFRFLPWDDFNPTERLFFLNDGFSFPLKTYRLTSLYGLRVNPITGRTTTHRGVDLAAPGGTPVYAARAGTVSEIGEDPIYGRYVIVSHGGNLKSLYGHLSKIETAVNREVKTDTLIGRVGSTGQSTGPHLHFEIRLDGRAQDPGKYLKLFQQ